jgi:hypothetical protein
MKQDPIWHTVFVTSALYTHYGIYTPEQRIQQTLATVKSVKKYLPNSTIILVDNSTVGILHANDETLGELDEEVDYWIDNSGDSDIQYFHEHCTNYDVGKNSMEVIGFLKTLRLCREDEEISKIIAGSTRVFKLSGRYELTDKFNIDRFNNDETNMKYVFRKPQPAWIPKTDTGVDQLYQTRLWSFDGAMLDETISMFESILRNMLETYNQQKYIDVEHSMAKYLPAGRVVELDHVGIMGNIAPNGMMVIE